MVLTGGGVLLKEIEEKAGEVFNADTKIGVPMHVGGLDGLSDGPEFATAIGLLLYGAQYEQKYGIPQRPGRLGLAARNLWSNVRGFMAEMF